MLLKKIGMNILYYFSAVPYLLGYIGRTFASSTAFIHREKGARKVLIMQLLFTFIEALPIIAVLSCALGSALYIIGYSFLVSIGQRTLIYNLMAIIVIRELGPLLVAFVVTARSATAIATELGGMVTTHQIESFIACGIDPIDYLVAPRFLGVTLSVFFLNLYFACCGIVGPALISFFVNPVAVYDYFPNLFKNISVFIIIVSIIKSLVFGMIISIIATYYGFNVERASTEIPVAGIQAVSKSFVGIIVADVIIIVLASL